MTLTDRIRAAIAALREPEEPKTQALPEQDKPLSEHERIWANFGHLAYCNHTPQATQPAPEPEHVSISQGVWPTPQPGSLTDVPHHTLRDVIQAFEAEFPEVPHEITERALKLWHHTPQAAFAADLPQDQETNTMATAPVNVPVAGTVGAAVSVEQHPIPSAHDQLIARAFQYHADLKANAFTSFFSKVKDVFVKLFGKTPQWVQIATAAITYTAPFIEGILALVEPAAVAPVAALVAKVESALAAAQAVIKDAGSTPTVLTYLNAVKADIAQIESAAQVKDDATKQKLSALTTLIVNEINAVVAELPSATSVSA